MAALLRFDFLVDGNKVGEDSSSPYGYDWPSMGVGNHVLSVLAVYDDGTTESFINRSITVNSSTGGTSGYLLDDEGAAPFAFSLNRKLKANPTKPAFRVEDVTTAGVFEDIGFAGDEVDMAAYNAFASSKVAVYITRVYNHGTGADWIMGGGTVSSAPRIRDNSADIKVNNKLALYHKDLNDFLEASISGVSTASLFVVGADNTTNRFQTVNSSVSNLIAQGGNYPDFDMNAGAGTPNNYINGTLLTDTDRLAFRNAFTFSNSATLSVLPVDLSAWTTFRTSGLSNVYGMQYMQEVILWGSDKSSRRTTIEANQKAYYGIV